MWTRNELKNQAKLNLRGKYWMALVVSLIISVLGAGFRFSWGFDARDFQFTEQDWSRFQSGDFQEFLNLANRFFDSGIGLLALAAALFAVLIAVAYSIFVSSVIQVGGNRWFSRSREAAATPSLGQIFSLFKSGSFLRTVGGMLWMNLFLFLWGLLAVLPALAMAGVMFTRYVNLSGLTFDWNNNPEIILQEMGTIIRQVLPAGLLTLLVSVVFSIPVYIKTYSYRMTPWILADNPQIGFKRALKLSMELTRGHKLNIWVLDLSFIGWFILGVLACGVGVLFVIPYYYAVQAELFANLRQEGVNKGFCTMEEFGFLRIDTAAPVPAQPAGN